jgi:hypothetical protein
MDSQMKRKRFKHLFYALTIILFAVMISNSQWFIIPAVNAAVSSPQEKGLSYLSNVVGLDLSKYNTVSTTYPSDSFKDILPRENVRYALNSDKGKIDALCTFVGGSLQMLEIFTSEGSQYSTLPTSSAVEFTRDFLSNYQAQSKDPLYGQLSSIAAKIDVSKNVTSAVGNTKLKVTTSGDGKDLTFIWTYIINGIEAPDKSIALRYENGFLRYFVNNWNFYKIGKTEVNLSEQEAIDIATAEASSHSLTDESGKTGIKFNVAKAMIYETILAPSIYVDADKARSSDLLELFPLRHVWVSLDKIYPGNVYGFNVYVWADTKEVCYVHERVITMDPPAELVATESEYTPSSSSDQFPDGAQSASNTFPISWVLISALTFTTLTTVPVYLRTKKKVSKPASTLPKTLAVLLCLLLSLTVLIGLSETVANATPYNGRAAIWGAESTGAMNLNNGFSWRKSYNEVTWQRNSASYIAGLFQDNGYTSNNYQGTSSSKTLILNQISASEGAYSRVAVVDFDHGVLRNDYSLDYGQYHYMLEDNYGVYDGPTPGYSVWPGTDHPNYPVYDMDIYQKTTGKIFFAFINTCMSANTAYGNGNNANGKAVGMPYAWTHQRVGYGLGSDGYKYPDGTLHCYIGFDGGSAALAQSIERTTFPYYHWIYHFFYFALTSDYTIHQALDMACQDMFTGSPAFDQSPLGTSYTSRWPMWILGQWRDSYQGRNYFGPGTMKVYGNANLKLYQPMLAVYNNLGQTFTVDGNNFGYYAAHRVYPGTHTIDVTVPGYYSFQYFYYYDLYTGWSTYIYYHPVTLQINHNSNLVAVFSGS